MAAKEIKATSAKLAGREVTVNYDFGENLDEAIAKFGKESIHSNFVANVVITIQSGMRHLAEGGKETAGKTDAEIQAVYDAWKPGIARPRVGDTVSMLEKFSKLDEAKQEDLLTKLKELRAKKAAAAAETQPA
jgi:hypothetical protein